MAGPWRHRASGSAASAQANANPNPNPNSNPNPNLSPNPNPSPNRSLNPNPDPNPNHSPTPNPSPDPSPNPKQVRPVSSPCRGSCAPSTARSKVMTPTRARALTLTLTLTLTLAPTLTLTVRMLAVLREPSRRLHSAYYFWPQYRRRYGVGGAGFVAYIQDTLPALRDCFSAHGPRLCARSFEGLDQKYEQVGK